MNLAAYTDQFANVLAHPNWVSTTLTPSFAYPGGKARLRTTIVSFMPQSIRTYAEPFVGRGNVYWKAASTVEASNWWLNDLRIASFFEYLISDGNTLIVPEHTREQFELLRRTPDDPASILLAPYITYSGAGYPSGYRPEKGSPSQAGYERTLRRAHEILVETQPRITTLDWKLVTSELGEQDFAFFDPPYADCKVGGYKSNDINHEELVDELQRAPYRWLLSEYEHPAYARLGSPFWRKDVQLRSTNFRDDGGKGRRVECLWRNY
jgi:site-specific DNA-adenine methylase